MNLIHTYSVQVPFGDRTPGIVAGKCKLLDAFTAGHAGLLVTPFRMPANLSPWIGKCQPAQRPLMAGSVQLANNRRPRLTILASELATFLHRQSL